MNPTGSRTRGKVPQRALADTYTHMVDLERVKVRLLERRILLLEHLLQARSLGIMVGGRIRHAGLLERLRPVAKVPLRKIIAIDDDLNRIDGEIASLEVAAERARQAVRQAAYVELKNQAALRRQEERGRLFSR